MERPANLHRIAVLHHLKLMEQCVLAVSQGRVKGVVDDPEIVGDDDFVAMMSFVKLSREQARVDDGLVFLPVTGGPTVSESGWVVCKTADEAIAQLEAVKANLLAANWLEGEFDPVNDPD